MIERNQAVLNNKSSENADYSPAKRLMAKLLNKEKGINSSFDLRIQPAAPKGSFVIHPPFQKKKTGPLREDLSEFLNLYDKTSYMSIA